MQYTPNKQRQLNGATGKFAKKFAPLISGLFESSRGRSILRMLDLYLNALQGKGAAGNWNFESEIRAVGSFVRSTEPVIFDVGANLGSWSAAMQSHLAPRKCRLHLFEPLPENLKVLRGKIDRDWQLVEAAVGGPAAT